MYIIKNALVSITRNKGRNFLIGIIVIVIAFASSIALAIRASANNLISSYENQYDITATLGINRELMRQEMKMDKDLSSANREEQKNNMTDIFQTASNLTISDIENYGNSKYVKDYYYTLSVGVNSESLESATLDFNKNNSPNNPSNHGVKPNFKNISSSDFTLVGYSSLSSLTDFITGNYRITSGELTDLESSTCVINSELANLNDLEIDDELILIDPDDETNTITLTIKGIYEETSQNSDAMSMFTSSVNTIITNTNVIRDFTNKNEEMHFSLTPTFILTSIDAIEKYTQELNEKGLSEYLSLTTNLDQINSATSSISNVKTFATTFLIITLLIGGIILFILSAINIRERKYEIGVLRTIGMKKRYLTMQFIIELFLISFISLLIGGTLGAMSSVRLSNHLLQNEITNANEKKEDITQNFGGNKANIDFEANRINGMVNVQAITSIDAVVDFQVLLKLFSLGTLLTLISSLSSMLSIQKFSPLTILKERS